MKTSTEGNFKNGNVSLSVDTRDKNDNLIQRWVYSKSLHQQYKHIFLEKYFGVQNKNQGHIFEILIK